MATTEMTMEELLAEAPVAGMSAGDVVEGTVIAAEKHEVWLDLGGVSSSAEVHVNGKPAGVKLAPPYRVDISRLVLPGANRIEVLVYSALSNHYQTIPTRYRGEGPSGLLGPVRLAIRVSD